MIKYILIFLPLTYLNNDIATSFYTFPNCTGNVATVELVFVVMGASITRTDFTWLETEAPQGKRRKEILSKLYF